MTKCLSDRTRAEQEAQRRLASDPDFEARKDFFHYLFHAQDPVTGRGFPMEELWGEAESLIIAGSDTTAIVLTAMFFYLARKPDVQVSSILPTKLRLCFCVNPFLTVPTNARPGSPTRSFPHSKTSTT